MPVRRVWPILKELIDAVTDEHFQHSETAHWSLWMAALWKFTSTHKSQVLRKSVRHNIGKRRTAHLIEYMKVWRLLGRADLAELLSDD